MSITPDRLLSVLNGDRPRNYGKTFSDVGPFLGSGGRDLAVQTVDSGEVHGTDDNEQHQIERCLSKLRVLGFCQIAAIFSWSMIPVAPLLSHLGIVIFGRETEDQPVWWQLISSPERLARLSDRLHEE